MTKDIELKEGEAINVNGFLICREATGLKVILNDDKHSSIMIEPGAANSITLLKSAEVKTPPGAKTDNGFIYNEKTGNIECRCGHVAVKTGNGYVCGTITAYPCEYVRGK